MGLPVRWAPHSITAQITGLVAASVFLGLTLTIGIVFLLSDGAGARGGASAAAGRIAQFTRLTKAAGEPVEVDVIVAAARRAGMAVTKIARAELETAYTRPTLSVTPLGFVAHQLRSGWGLEVIEGVQLPDHPDRDLAVVLDDDTALLFDGSSDLKLWKFFLAPAALILTIVLIFLMFLSIYAVHWIIAPLSAVAAAAHSFGRFPDVKDRIANRRGPREITQVADALNDMRIRIRTLLDDRTRMLTAISHDLRTPLTRLRLRAERVSDQELRDGMLQEITRVSRMLNETLSYLRKDVRAEEIAWVDLPSFLQMICSAFADVGHCVAYEGPGRLAWNCRASALTRAVSNLVDNGVKYGSCVMVGLRVRKDGAVEIDVSDDGPGIPPDLREKVLEPFFKVDAGRVMGDGFGLGLSIACDVIKGHGGELRLLERHPVGLIVRITLPAAVAEKMCKPLPEDRQSLVRSL